MALGLHQSGTADALRVPRASQAGQAAYDMGWGDAEGSCLPRGVIKTTFFGSIRWVGFFLGDAGKLKKKAAMEKVRQRGTLCLHSWC